MNATMISSDTQRYARTVESSFQSDHERTGSAHSGSTRSAMNDRAGRPVASLDRTQPPPSCELSDTRKPNITSSPIALAEAPCPTAAARPF